MDLGVKLCPCGGFEDPNQSSQLETSGIGVSQFDRCTSGPFTPLGSVVRSWANGVGAGLTTNRRAPSAGGTGDDGLGRTVFPPHPERPIPQRLGITPVFPRGEWIIDPTGDEGRHTHLGGHHMENNSCYIATIYPNACIQWMMMASKGLVQQYKFACVLTVAGKNEQTQFI